jgi:hypothetical protein
VRRARLLTVEENTVTVGSSWPLSQPTTFSILDLRPETAGRIATNHMVRRYTSWIAGTVVGGKWNQAVDLVDVPTRDGGPLGQLWFHPRPSNGHVHDDPRSRSNIRRTGLRGSKMRHQGLYTSSKNLPS